MTQERLCTNCKHAILRDTGYSNWTVMGTSLSCDIALNDVEDTFYDEEPGLKVAEECASYIDGGPAEHRSVDCPYECRDGCTE